MDQYFVVVEQSPLIEVQDLVKGIFVVLALHYVFNTQYNCRLCDFYLFFEDNILSIPTSLKKSTSYCNITAAIECYF